MKKLIAVSLSVLLGACASNKAQQVEILCDTYSKAHQAASMMKDNGLTEREAKVCAVANVTSLNQMRLCEGNLSEADIQSVKDKVTYASQNKEKMDQMMVLWVVSVVHKVYNNPEIKTHDWKFQSAKYCETVSEV